jgi:hypothetical protein
VDGQSEIKHAARRGPIRRSFEPSPRFADSFGVVLLLLIVTYFVLAAGGDYAWGRVTSLVTVAATTWFALRAAQARRRAVRLAEALIPVATIVAVVLVLVGDEETATIVGGTLTALLVVVAPVTILRRLLEHPVVSLNTFYGAVCVYLLIAMFFASAFRVIGALSGEPFFVQMQDPANPATQIDYLYFAFITMTTVGYGDLTAASSVGRMAAALLAIFGQLYLITVVAIVVQNLGQKKLVERQAEPGDAAAGDDDAGDDGSAEDGGCPPGRETADTER